MHFIKHVLTATHSTHSAPVPYKKFSNLASVLKDIASTRSAQVNYSRLIPSGSIKITMNTAANTLYLDLFVTNSSD